MHTYYLVKPVSVKAPREPGVPGVFGDSAKDLDLRAQLFAVYMRELGNGEPGRYDGAATTSTKGSSTFVRVCVGCSGAGTGVVRDVVVQPLTFDGIAEAAPWAAKLAAAGLRIQNDRHEARLYAPGDRELVREPMVRAYDGTMVPLGTFRWRPQVLLGVFDTRTELPLLRNAIEERVRDAGP